MNNDFVALSSDSIALFLTPTEIYLWAIQGPFESGTHSALTMAKIIYVVKGEGKLDGLEGELVSHEKNYTQDQFQWERLRKEFIRENLSEIGFKERKYLNQAENDIQSLNDQHPSIVRILPNLNDWESEKKNKIKNNEIASQDNSVSSSSKTHSSYTSDVMESNSTEESMGWFDKAKLKFLRLIEGMTVLILIAIFLSVWGILISRNFILGLSLGWIPAFIISCMASIFAPLLMLLSALLIFSTVGLLAWLGYVYFI